MKMKRIVGQEATVAGYSSGEGGGQTNVVPYIVKSQSQSNTVLDEVSE